MKKHILFIVFALLTSFAFGQIRDSIVARKVTIPVTHDTTFVVTVPTSHDSSYTVYDTLHIPTSVVLKGMYGHPNQVTIGNSSSENIFLAYAKSKGTNMLNMYARAYLYDDTKRTQLAAFTQKAKDGYGMVLVTVDVRFTDSHEEPGWRAYLAKYAGTKSAIEPLTEFEPYTKNSSGVYDYAGFFYLVRTMGNLCKQYNVKFNFYEGWIGNNYNGLSFSQAPVDSMVKYCDRIFISNYVTTSDYNSTSSSLGKWDSRMDKRCGYLVTGCQHAGKLSIDIVEIVSLEQTFLYAIYACPSGVLCTACTPDATQACNGFYGQPWIDDQAAYKLSTTAVLQYTKLVGRTIFYSYYAQKAQP